MSVAKQSYLNIEHVIVDGASRDATAQIVSSAATPKTTFVSEPDRGIYDAWNKGIRRATGDYIWLLNSDDQVFDDTAVSDAVNFIISHDSPPVVYAKIKAYEKSTGYSYVAGAPTGLDGFVYGMKDFCILATIIRKDVFERVGYFSEDYQISSDYDWAIKLFKALPKSEIIFFDRIITNFSVGGVSNLRYREAYAEVSKIIRKHYPYRIYLIHKVYFSYRLLLMSLVPVARKLGLLSVWRRYRELYARWLRESSAPG